MRRLLLGCGMLASLWYAAINIIVPLQWPQYSVTGQTISELSAIDAPTRPLWLVLVAPYLLLFAAFGWGTLLAAGTSRALRAAGWIVLFYCLFNAYWPPMHLREVLAAGGGTFSDTLHLVWAGVTTALFVLIMGCAMVALPGSFRRFTLFSLLLLALFGGLTALDAPDVARNLPTPLAGVWERINIGIFLLWIATFAFLLMRRPPGNLEEERA
jgi:hypothetical protein